MATKCNNCKACISCTGAKQRIASNGASVCTFCIGAYEAQLTEGTPSPHYTPLSGNARAPIVNGVRKG